jgi:hypothetical protein
MLLSVGTSVVYCAKAKDLVIEFDFLSGTLTPLKEKRGDLKEVNRFTVAKGKNVIFKIIHFNRFSYKAAITADLVVHNFNAKAPSQFSDLFPAEEEAETLAVAAPVTPADPIEQLNDAIKKLEKIKKLQVNLEEALYTAPSFRHLEIQKNKFLKDFLAGKPFDPNRIEDEAITQCRELQNDAMKTFDDITKNEIGKLGETGEKLLKDLEELEQLSNSKKTEEIENKLQSIDKAGYKKVFEKYAKDGNFWLSLSRKLSQLEDMMKEFKEKKYIDVIKNIFASMKQENFEVSLTVPTVDADEIKFNVIIESVDKKKAPVYRQLKSPVVVKVKGGWLFDFSAGVLFQFDAHDEVYRFDETPGDTENVTLRMDTHQHSMTPVLGALMHTYPRQTVKVKWVITFGAGIGEADDLSYYLGLGAMLGAKRRFVISFGAAAIKYARLLPEYRVFVDDKMPKNDDLTPEDMVRASYKLRPFLSLTYNF